ncbi:MAG: hypothetical protein QM775_02535 [Pirellulales bacterium]
MTAAGELMAYRHRGFFFAMDTYRDYLALNEMWDAGLCFMEGLVMSAAVDSMPGAGGACS